MIQMQQIVRKGALTIASAIMFTAAMAQKDAKPIASPRDSVSGTIEGAHISINYGSPSVKGRKIWGDLVPYDKVWRAGANEATRFTTDKPLTMQGQVLPAGTYALFAIPTSMGWTFIFNKVANQWGAYKYEASEDQLKVQTKPIPVATNQEALKYKITQNGFSLTWEKLEVPVFVQVKK